MAGFLRWGRTAGHTPAGFARGAPAPDPGSGGQAVTSWEEEHRLCSPKHRGDRAEVSGGTARCVTVINLSGALTGQHQTVQPVVVSAQDTAGPVRHSGLSSRRWLAGAWTVAPRASVPRSGWVWVSVFIFTPNGQCQVEDCVRSVSLEMSTVSLASSESQHGRPLGAVTRAPQSSGLGLFIEGKMVGRTHTYLTSDSLVPSEVFFTLVFARESVGHPTPQREACGYIVPFPA